MSRIEQYRKREKEFAQSGRDRARREGARARREVTKEEASIAKGIVYAAAQGCFSSSAQLGWRKEDLSANNY